MHKIVLVIPTLKQGGAERVISILANEWASRGLHVTLILLAKSEIFYCIDKRVNCIKINSDIEQNNFKKAISYIRLVFQLRKEIKMIKPDFVLSFLDQYNIVTILSTRFLNVKTFISDRSNPNFEISKSLNFLKRKIYIYSDGLIAQTSLAKSVIGNKTKHKNIKVIPNPVFIHDIDYNCKKEKIILSVGRLVPEKAQHYLLEMMSVLDEPDWKLVILGDGFLRTDLEQKIEELKISDKVTLVGEVSNVGKWLQKSSIFAFSSISEGFPNALVEAMASGLPCVSFDCDAGPKDIIIDKKNGFLIPVGDVKSFTNSVKLLINDEKLRNDIASEGIKIKDELDAPKIAELYFNFCTNNLIV